ncbi:MAG: hypothetical protein UY72_C0029G0008 [Candidatus Uhrbacteria bacterium GW2011_GWD2_52_7]|uniref:Uncharacterized protein n=1 Tax=Candidatus Uhrbacteria bacterium GW2011_GWD2_52_7 TaxID=1618989 RepID=A0A0G1XG75_9BACT|nr:MAG: hypothetical protein UY72_C0029G0008 [Candidatus Uhrbacteria bacterium GW2011_GWD2_52_7]
MTDHNINEYIHDFEKSYNSRPDPKACDPKALQIRLQVTNKNAQRELSVFVGDPEASQHELRRQAGGTRAVYHGMER